MDMINGYDDVDGDGAMEVLCMICNEIPKKYKCPRCSILTCSLNCVKIHKKNTNCSGIRDATTFVTMNDYNQNHIRNDYHFLENVLNTKISAKSTLVNQLGGDRSTGNGKHNIGKEKPNAGLDALGATKSTQQLDIYSASVKKLVKAAYSKGVKLILMSPGMTKRNNNTSRYLVKTDEIMWKVHLVFILNANYDPNMLLKPDLDGLNYLTDEKADVYNPSHDSTPLLSVTLSMSENSTLDSVLVSNFFEQNNTNTFHRYLLRSLRINQSTLKSYVQKIPSTSHDPVFVEIDLKDCLRNILNGKTVIEYPTIIIGECKNTNKLKTIITPIDTTAHHPTEKPTDSNSSIDYAVGIEDVDKIIETNKRGSLMFTSSHSFTHLLTHSLTCTGYDDDIMHIISMKRKKLQDINSASAAENVEGINQVCADATAPMDTYGDSDDSDDSEEEIEFFKALQEMEGKDITQLKAMLMQEEDDTS